MSREQEQIIDDMLDIVSAYLVHARVFLLLPNARAPLDVQVQALQTILGHLKLIRMETARPGGGDPLRVRQLLSCLKSMGTGSRAETRETLGSTVDTHSLSQYDEGSLGRFIALLRRADAVLPGTKKKKTLASEAELNRTASAMTGKN